MAPWNPTAAELLPVGNQALLPAGTEYVAEGRKIVKLPAVAPPELHRYGKVTVGSRNFTLAAGCEPGIVKS